MFLLSLFVHAGEKIVLSKAHIAQQHYVYSHCEAVSLRKLLPARGGHKVNSLRPCYGNAQLLAAFRGNNTFDVPGDYPLKFSLLAKGRKKPLSSGRKSLRRK